MKNIKCSNCGQEMSQKAPTCPKCGHPNKKANHLSGGETLMGLGIAIAVIWWLASGDSSSSSENKKQVDLAACKAELQCWGDRNISGAGVYCKDHVERLAKYSARWTDGTFETKFSRFRWLDQSKGTLTYIGDKIEFQNGFGAHQAHIYECDYNPETNVVSDVRARPGRL